MTGFEAKDAGTLAEGIMRDLEIGWVTFEGRRVIYRSKEKGEHYRLIVAAMRAKLEQNPRVREVLLLTGDLILKPDHVQELDPPAEWRYFDIWMELRSELQRAAIRSASWDPHHPTPSDSPAWRQGRSFLKWTGRK